MKDTFSDRMSRAEEFRNLQRELLKDRGIGAAELQAAYLGEIARNLAIIADCLEQKKANDKRRAE